MKKNRSFRKKLCAIFASVAFTLGGCSAPSLLRQYFDQYNVPPDGCAKTEMAEVPIKVSADSQKVLTHARKLSRLLQTLPETGQTVQKNLYANGGLQICSSEYMPHLGIYAHSIRTAIVREEVLRTDNVSVHEIFHAHQSDNGATEAVFNASLSIPDAAMATMLKEATAAAYELMVESEAQAMGYMEDPYKMGHNTVSTKQDVRNVFMRGQELFFRHRAENTDPKLLNAKALEAGGLAVVTYLLRGYNAQWRDVYGQNVVERSKYYKPENDIPDNQVAYQKHRQKLFTAMGQINKNINITPRGLRGTHIDGSVHNYLRRLRLAPSPDYARHKINGHVFKQGQATLCYGIRCQQKNRQLLRQSKKQPAV